MPSIVTFTGSPFNVVSASVRLPLVLRVRFTFAPLASNAANVNDALNPANYSLSGPSSISVAFVVPVIGDPEVVDLALTTPITPGSWVLTVTNVQTSSGASLLVNTAAFFASDLGNETSLTAGSEDEGDPARVIRKHLLPTLSGPNWDAVIEALSRGDDVNWQNAQKIFDQLFITSASEQYLIRHASDRGVKIPQSGIAEEALRNLIVALSTEKITTQSFYKILEIFFGGDAVFARIESQPQPFALDDGDLLFLEIEGRTVKVVFASASFTSIGSATAAEIANVITRAIKDSGVDGWASAYTEPETQQVKVRIYTGTRGVSGSVAVTGGSAQQVLRFALEKAVYSGDVTSFFGYNWNYTQLNPDTVRITLTANSPIVNLTFVEVGNYLVIGRGVGVIPTGSYRIVNVGYSSSGISVTQSVDIEANFGFSGSILQTSNQNYRFFSPKKFNTLNGERTVSVTQSSGAVQIQIPATSSAVDRTSKSGAFLGSESESITVDNIYRTENGLVNLFFTAPITPFGIGEKVTVKTGRAEIPVINPGTPGTHPAIGTADASLATVYSSVQTPPSSNTNNSVALQLDSSTGIFIGGTRTVTGTTTTSNQVNRFRLLSPVALSTPAAVDGAERAQYQWLASANLPASRTMHAGSVLRDGRVLVTGGSGTFTNPVPTNTTYLYTPATNTWTNGPAMTTARFGHTQTTLADGRVLVVGGVSTATWQVAATAEVFDPATLVWTVISTGIPRAFHTATLLNNGNVLISGGETLSENYVDRAADTLAFWQLNDPTSPLDGGPGATYDLTVTGSARTSIAGRFQNAIRFSGDFATNGVVDTTSADLLRTGEYTIQIWVLEGSAGAVDEPFLAYSSASAGVDFQTLINIGATSSEVYFKYQRPGGSTVRHSLPLPSSYPYQVTLTKKNFTSTVEFNFYVNARKLIATEALSDGPDGGKNSSWWMCRDPKTLSVFTGALDLVRVLTRALTDYEIHADIVNSKGSSTVAPLYGSGKTLNSCQIFEPSSSRFSSTGSMSKNRSRHESFLLPDGRVLALGGCGYAPSDVLPQQTDYNNFSYWPNNAVLDAEVFENGYWKNIGTLPEAGVGPVVGQIPARNQILFNGSGAVIRTISYGGAETAASTQPAVREHRLDTRTLKWKAGLRNPTVRFDRIVLVGAKELGAKELVLYGGRNANDINTVAAGGLRVAAADEISAKTINSDHTVVSSTATKTTVRVEDPGFTVSTSGSIISNSTNGTRGVFSVDPKQGFTVTAFTSLASSLLKGNNYSQIELLSGLDFPDSTGFLILGYGEENQSEIVAFYEKISPNIILLNFEFNPKSDFLAGSTVALVEKTPANAVIWSNGNSFATGSQLGRIDAQAAIQAAAAAGIALDFDIRYPGDRGLGGEGGPVEGQGKKTDAVVVWGK